MSFNASPTKAAKAELLIPNPKGRSGNPNLVADRFRPHAHAPQVDLSKAERGGRGVIAQAEVGLHAIHETRVSDQRVRVVSPRAPLFEGRAAEFHVRLVR